VSASLAATLGLAFLLVRKWDELETGVTGAPLAIVAAAVSLQLLALVARSEAWHVCVRASGGSVGRRALYRASSMGFVGGLLHTQLGTVARIAALRRSAPAESPRVPALIGAELPILIVEGGLAALTSFTLVGPLGLPWWTPLLCLAALVAASAALRTVAAAGVRWLRSGLAVMRTFHGRARLGVFVLIAVLAQVARNWLLLHAVGVDASLFDAIAVLIAVVSLGQLPFGLSVGAAASVLILGPQGVTAAAAAGVLLTATGTVGGLMFAGWGALDTALSDSRVRALALRAGSGLARLGAPGLWLWTALGALGAQFRRAIERSCFDVFGHLQARPLLATASDAGLHSTVALVEQTGAPKPLHFGPTAGRAKTWLTDTARHGTSSPGIRR
jgi:Lysylphosphatidylglycerol synthase TM region